MGNVLASAVGGHDNAHDCGDHDCYVHNYVHDDVDHGYGDHGDGFLTYCCH